MKITVRKRFLRGVLWCVLAILGLLMIIPFLWTISASLKTNTEIFSVPFRWIPETFHWENYVKIWTEIPFLTYYLNTLKIAVIVTVGQVLTSSLAAYSFAKMNYPGRDKVFLCYLATMMIPFHAIMIPQFIMVKNFGLYDSHWALIILETFSALGVFIMRQYMLGIPNELSEAARIDGCGELAIYSKIIMPICKPAIATLTIFSFNFAWNDYMGPLIYLTSDNLKTIQLGLASFRSLYRTDYSLIMAGTICSLLPMVLIFIFAQKYLIEGISFSGLKG